MPYKIAGIDVHKKMLAVVVSDVEVDGEYQFERRMFGKHWNGIGNRYARSGKAQAGCRERCIWRRRNRTAARGDARGISPMPNDWSSGW